MYNGKLTDHDKLEIAQYTVDLLMTALTNHGPYNDTHTQLVEWLNHADGECIMRLGQYIGSERRVLGGEL